nr:hypothetical protein [Chlamydiota bacterium]
DQAETILVWTQQKKAANAKLDKQIQTSKTLGARVRELVQTLTDDQRTKLMAGIYSTKNK